MAWFFSNCRDAPWHDSTTSKTEKHVKKNDHSPIDDTLVRDGVRAGHGGDDPARLHPLCSFAFGRNARAAGRPRRRAVSPPQRYPQRLHPGGQRRCLRLLQLRPLHRPRDEHLQHHHLFPQWLRRLCRHHPLQRIQSSQQLENHETGGGDGRDENPAERRPDPPRHDGGLLQCALLHGVVENATVADGDGGDGLAARATAEGVGTEIAGGCAADGGRPLRPQVQVHRL